MKYKALVILSSSACLLAQTQSAPQLQPRSVPVYSGDVQISVSPSQRGVKSLVLWNGAPLQTTSTSSQLMAVIPAAMLQNLGYAEIAVYDMVSGVTSPPAYFFTYVPITANSIIYDSARHLIYCSVPSTAPRFGNSIVAVNPDTGDFVTSVFIGSEPTLMAMSDDSQFLYVALDGASAVRRLNLVTFQPELQFALDQASAPNQIGGYGLFAADIKVVPGSPNSVVVSRRYNGLSPDYAGTAVYDNGVMRPKVTPTHTGSRKVAFGGSASVLWGLVNNVGGMQRLTIDNTGITIANGNQFGPDITGVLGYDFKFDSDSGLYYLDSGSVVDANQKIVVGRFAASGPLQPDVEKGRVFYASTSITGSNSLIAFDSNTFVPLGSIPTPDSIGTGLLRWGSNGVAMLGGASYIFDTSNAGKLFIFRTPLADVPPSASADAIVNAASQLAGPISPGEILSIYGANLGPADGRTLQLDRSGHVGNTLGSVQVLFDSVPGTLTYVGANQVNVVAPYSIARKSSTSVVITNMGIPSAAINMQVASASPAVFTADGSGSGAAAILNENQTQNSTANPALAGSVITLFGTGEGVTSPPGADGSVTGANPPSIATPLSATVDGIAADVLYQGEAPGIVSGVFQMNIRLPSTARSGAAPVVVYSGKTASRTVTVTIK